MAQQSRRHHFIPKFLSKLWTGKDGKLCEYSRPHDRLIMRRKAPKAVGYEFDLYSLPGAIPEHLTFVEDQFFAAADQRACDALQIILAGMPSELSPEHRGAFTRLLVSLHHRTPERVKAIQEGLAQSLERLIEEIRVETGVGISVPLSEVVADFDQIVRRIRIQTRDFSWGTSLMGLVDSNRVGPAIYSMRWAIKRLSHTEHDLMLGDHPLVTSNGFARNDGYIALPLGPRLLFLATNNLTTERHILGQNDGRIARGVNRETLRHAKRFVYATGEQHAKFVDRRLGLPPAA